jgi:hypothetical protein
MRGTRFLGQRAAARLLPLVWHAMALFVFCPSTFMEVAAESDRWTQQGVLVTEAAADDYIIITRG